MSRSVLPLKEQYRLFDVELQHRIQTVMPVLMKKHNLEMWIVLNREYNEDPVYLTLVPSLCKTARRLSCLVFSYVDGVFETYNVGKVDPELNKLYKSIYQPHLHTQYECLTQLIQEKNPTQIGLNYSSTFAFADGLTKTIYDELVVQGGDEIAQKFTSAERLCIEWLETRTEQELARYQAICQLSTSIIDEAFSTRVITPGLTTTTDVEYFMMEAISELGLPAWFSPTIDVQRKGATSPLHDEIILPGDVVHCDMGLKYLGLCTDTQRLAYVLRHDETEIPAGLVKAFENGNRFQDVCAENFVEGLSGNDVFLNAVSQAKAEKINPKLYTHPIGTHGHGAGPTIGMWDQQHFIKGCGEYPLNKNTCYALELLTVCEVPEWDNQEIFVMLEETVAFRNNHELEFLSEGRTHFKIVNPPRC